MNTSKIKRTLLKEAEAIRPSSNVLSKIKLDLGIESTIQKKVYTKKVSFVFASAVAFGILAIIAVALIVSGVGYNGELTDTYISIDINPSIELSIDKDNNITSLKSMNEDAAVMLYDVDLVGLNFELAIDEIIELAIETGYIDPLSSENAVKFVVINGDLDKEKEMNDKVKNKLKSSFSNKGIDCEILEKFGNSSQAEAKAQRVSVGKMELIKAVREIDKNYKVSDLKNMSVSELNEIILSYDSTLIEMAENEIEENINDATQEIQHEIETLIDLKLDIETRFAAIQLAAQNNPDNTTEVRSLVTDFNSKYQSFVFQSQSQNNATMYYQQLNTHINNVLSVIEEDLLESQNEYTFEKNQAKKSYANGHGQGYRGGH